MNIDSAPTGLSADDVKKIMSVHGTWKFPGTEDGWFLIHNAFRWVMDAYLTGIQKTVALVEGGASLQEWQVQALADNYERFNLVLHHHHHFEEDHMFPFITKRVQLPPKLSESHVDLLVRLDEIKDLACVRLPAAPRTKDGCLQLLKDIEAKFAALKASNEDHFREEEQVGIPMMRKHFTQKEVADGPEKIILKEVTPADMAFLMRAVPDPKERARLMSQLGVPGFIQSLVMQPAINKDQATLVAGLTALAHGVPPPPPAPECQCAIM